jgi:hypothetical protein
MMGGRAFILLKAARRRQECPKQAEPGFVVLLKILGETVTGGPRSQLPPDMANSTKVVVFVIQFTIAAQKLTQYATMPSRKMPSTV